MFCLKLFWISFPVFESTPWTPTRQKIIPALWKIEKLKDCNEFESSFQSCFTETDKLQPVLDDLPQTIYNLQSTSDDEAPCIYFQMRSHIWKIDYRTREIVHSQQLKLVFISVRGEFLWVIGGSHNTTAVRGDSGTDASCDQASRMCHVRQQYGPNLQRGRKSRTWCTSFSQSVKPSILAWSTTVTDLTLPQLDLLSSAI